MDKRPAQQRQQIFNQQQPVQPNQSNLRQAPSTGVQQKTQIPQPQQSELIFLVRSNVGQNRVVMQSNQILNELYAKISEIVGRPPEGFFVEFEGRSLNASPGQSKLGSIPKLECGTLLTVKDNPKYVPKQPTKMQEEQPNQQPVIRTANGNVVTAEKLQKFEHLLQSQPNKQEHMLSSNCNHGPLARCVSCLNNEKSKGEQEIDDKKVDTSLCNHGPNGKCLNCSGATKEDLKEKKGSSKLLCQHGPNGKCSHCLESDQISNIKHMAFDQYLNESKQKCFGQHPPEGKCNNCLPPTAVSYKVKRDCKNHAPWPQAMCNACLPPSVVLKRQPYRHVDYVEFLNIPEMGNFVQYWSAKGKAEQRVGFLYGYYAEDMNYKGGVRAIVEAIYEPPQKGLMGAVEFSIDPFENEVNQIAGHLGLERIGWVFTTINHDCFLTSQEIRQAARFQQDFNVTHHSGCKVSKFLTVVLRPKKDHPEEVVPEVYMISDQFQQLEFDKVFTESGRRRIIQVREPENEQYTINLNTLNRRDIIPNFIYEGKTVKEFEPDFFIVNVAQGYNPNSNYNILKLYDFPVENRATQIKPSDLKTHLHKHQKKQSSIRFSNFHLLLFLAKFIDIDVLAIQSLYNQTVAIIADMVGQEQDVPDELQEVIKLYSDQ